MSNEPCAIEASLTQYYAEIERQEKYDADIEKIIKRLRLHWARTHEIHLGSYKGEWCVTLWEIDTEGNKVKEISPHCTRRTIEEAAKLGEKLYEDHLYEKAKRDMEVMLAEYDGD